MEKHYTSLTIKNWSVEDRPREKLLDKGRSALSEAELLAILIGSGTKKESAVDLCKRILASVNNNLTQLAKLSVQDLMQFNGIGEAKAITIVAALELGRRRKDENLVSKPKLTSSKAVFNHIHAWFLDLPHEEFWLLTLNRANKPISKHIISKGGVSQTIVDPKIVMKNALNDLSSAIILAHNHPSGNLQPSEADKSITAKIKAAAALFDITLLDHLIVTDDNYFSFADEGIL